MLIESNYLEKTEPLSNGKDPVGQLFGFPNMAARARNQLLWSGRLNVVLKVTGSDPPPPPDPRRPFLTQAYVR